MPTISYRVTLTREERIKLHDISHNGKRSARVMLDALILLGVDQGEYQEHKNQSERDIATALHVSPGSINNLKKRFVEDGFEAALERKKLEPRPIHYDGDFQAHLTALACSHAPKGRACWSLRLLADKMVELKYVEKISHETVRRLLKKVNLSLGKRKNG